jgi:beta-lactamase regulating signal transducer with metallopeptidase domain
VQTSIAALPLVLVLLLLARVRLVQPRWRTWLAVLFFLRLVLPTVPEASWAPVAPVATNLVQVAAAPTVSEPAPASAPAFDWKSALAAVWLAGAVTTLSWLCVSHWQTRRWVLLHRGPALRWFETLAGQAREQQGVGRDIPVIMVRGLSTMAVFGWQRPQLLVPADLADRYTGGQIRGMLLHEFAHVRRRDVLWTWLALMVCALHWFNPLVWLAFRRFCADRELICDAMALEALGEGEGGRRSYGDALLRSLEVAPLAPAPSLAPFFHVHPEIKHRLLMITKPITANAWTRLAATFVATTITAFTFTTARAKADEEKPKREGERDRAAEREERKREREPKKEAAPKESELDKFKRESAERKAQRDGEVKKEGSRDGDQPREGAKRDGDAKKEGARDGEQPREGAKRDGEGRKAGPRDGEMKKEGPRDGEARKAGPRDGEAKKEGVRDGDQPREGAKRDGEGRKAGPRDGEAKKEGVRDGEVKKEGARDGEARKAGPRDGEAKKEGAADGEKPREGEKKDGDR